MLGVLLRVKPFANSPVPICLLGSARYGIIL